MTRLTGVGVVGLEHVNILIPAGREAEGRAFYGDLVGLPEIPQPEALVALGGCWFSLGSQALHLGAADPFVPAIKAHIALLVEDLDEAVRRFSAAGVVVRPDSRVPHVRRFYVSDPFGNRLEFIQHGDRF
jgi:catechol 2,3-dioxygenase-like lactoylglutathione lyase family enzyme